MKRLPGFDFLRSIALLLVLAHHFIPPPSIQHSVLGPLFSTLYGWWPSMEIFFVFSGFLVGGLLLRELRKTGEFNGRRFFMRRALKIFPSFFVLIGAVVVLRSLYRSPSALGHLLADATFMQDYFSGYFPHTWSLGVQEKFYLLICGVFSLGIVRSIEGRRKLCAWLVGWICVVPILRAITFAAWPFMQVTHYTPFHLRSDALAAGLMLAILHEDFPDRLTRWSIRSLTTVGVFCMIPSMFYPYQSRWPYIFGFSLQILGAASLILASSRMQFRTTWSGRAFIRVTSLVGKHSYSIFLWHNFYMTCIHRPFAKAVGVGPSVTFLTAFGGAIIFGCIMGEFLEQPILRLRDRYFPDSSCVRIREPCDESKPVAA